MKYETLGHLATPHTPTVLCAANGPSRRGPGTPNAALTAPSQYPADGGVSQHAAVSSEPFCTGHVPDGSELALVSMAARNPEKGRKPSPLFVIGATHVTPGKAGTAGVIRERFGHRSPAALSISATHSLRAHTVLKEGDMATPTPLTVTLAESLVSARIWLDCLNRLLTLDGHHDDETRVATAGILAALDQAQALAEDVDIARRKAIHLLNTGQQSAWHRRLDREHQQARELRVTA